MTSDKLHIRRRPRLDNPRLLLGLSGWMDGGDVSTGTVKYLVENLGAEKFSHIEPEGFYIYNFPGSMGVSSLFRPHTKIENGLVCTYEVPTNTFFCDEKNNLILFSGREPNLAWQEYTDCIFSLCSQFGVTRIYFVGSVAGLIPHTRKPRFFCSASDTQLKAPLQQHGIKFTNYEGPASIITYLMVRCGQKGIGTLSLVAEITPYVQGYNPRCVEAAVKCISGLLGLHVQLKQLRALGDEFEKKLNEIVQHQPELAAKIRKLEQDYDDEVFDTEMTDLKDWLQRQGIRVD